MRNLKNLIEKENKMEAREFRIENLVQYLDPNYNEWDIVSISIEDLPDIHLECFRPIPLTEEWLKRFGFYIDEVWVDWMISLPNNKYLGYDKKAKTFHLAHHNGSDFRDINLGEFGFVHQLQNLYFALTGKELTYEK